MPLYDWLCPVCNLEKEEFFKLADCPTFLDCPRCADKMKKVISKGHGGIKRVNPTWLTPQVVASLQDTDDIRAGVTRPIEDRNDLDRHVKENNLVAIG